MVVEAGPLRYPGTNLGVLVGAVIVDDQVDLKILRDGLLDLSEEALLFLLPVARPALDQHLPCPQVQGSEQGVGAMADVVMGDPLHVAQAYGQQGMRPVHGLDLRLLVYAKHHRPVGRIQVQAGDVPHLLDKEGIRRQLVAVKLPRVRGSSACAVAPSRSAASGERWSWSCRWQQRVSVQSSGFFRRWATPSEKAEPRSAGPG